MTLSGAELINLMEQLALNDGKIFMPDNFDEAIAKSIINFASRQHDDWQIILKEILEDYVKRSGFTLTIKEFGNKVPDLFMKAKNNHDKRKEFDLLVKQTQQRMSQ